MPNRLLEKFRQNQSTPLSHQRGRMAGPFSRRSKGSRINALEARAMDRALRAGFLMSPTGRCHFRPGDPASQPARPANSVEVSVNWSAKMSFLELKHLF
jgi:hypothetical protein